MHLSSVANSLIVLACLSFGPLAYGGGTYVDSKKCKECHESEYGVWDSTKHATSYRTIHREPKVKDFLAAIDGEKSIREDATSRSVPLHQKSR